MTDMTFGAGAIAARRGVENNRRTVKNHPSNVPPEKYLRVSYRWTFRSLDGPAGAIWWAWTAYELNGNEALRSKASFETLTECIEDAKEHGYVEPEQRW
jgi:hypothetical protein